MYDNLATYCVNTAYFIPKDDLYLLAVLNSNVVLYYYTNLSASIRGGYMRFFKQYVEQIPIPATDNEIRSRIESTAQSILITKAADPNGDTSALEEEVDRLVYGLYGLTDEEIAMIKSV